MTSILGWAATAAARRIPWEVGDGETLADTSHRAGCLQRSDGRGVVIDLVWPLLLLLVVSTSKPKGMQLTFVVVAARQAADKGAVRYKM
mgnify:CR=1 FL=1